MAYVASLLLCVSMMAMGWLSSLPDAAVGFGLGGVLLVSGGQHVVIAIVIASGLRALSRTPGRGPATQGVGDFSASWTNTNP